ncbi:MAG: sugar ABC transporter ATP-binding protein [Armatimonadetes bacterium]|nr:sugar ABC transporter ATP-binding protein [Armatimonadota bacterium]
MAERPLLQAAAVVKRFPGMVALDHVDFTLQPGEVHGLMGENGAGKSTLLKILTGAQLADEGSLELEGRSIRPGTPFEAAALGIRCVFQEVNLAPNLSVAENICLGASVSGGRTVKWKQMVDRAQSVLRPLGVDIDVRRPLSSHSLAVQQLVAIGRAVGETPKVLVLDEPTSSLDAAEVELVFAVIRRLKEQGIGIVFVSHFINQVYAICDRLTVLRNGQVVGTGSTDEINPQALVELMVGHKVESSGYSSERPKLTDNPSVLSTDGLGKRGTVAGIEIQARKGEILGLTGLLGSGRSETLNLLFGVEKADQGSWTLQGKPVKKWNARKAIASGMGYCPEDRKTQAIIPGLSVRENIVLAMQARAKVWASLSMATQRRVAGEMVQALGIKTTDIDKPVQFLSGGNQQKCMLARWLVMKPEVLLLDEPTRGVDVGAKEEILKAIQVLCADGMALVVADSELQEIVQIAQRVVVMRDRKMAGRLEGEAVTQEAVMEIMASGSGQ